VGRLAHLAGELELPARLERHGRSVATNEGDDGATFELALGRPSVLARELLEDAKDAALARVRDGHARRFEDAPLLDLRADAPGVARLARADERRQQVLASANRLEIVGLGRRHGGSVSGRRYTFDASSANAVASYLKKAGATNPKTPAMPSFVGTATGRER
jgi:hypothetical protein